MKLGFLILAHKNAGQCIRLVDALLEYHHSSVAIHVDKKAEEVYTTLREHYAGNEQVFFSKERFPVYWGSYNQVRATLELIRLTSKMNSDYFSLLSGQDFPIQPLNTFAQFLKQSAGTEFLVNFKLPDAQWEGEGGLNRLNLYWRNVKNREHSFFSAKLNGFMWRIQQITGYRRKLHYTYYGGSNWFTLSAAALRYINGFIDREPAYLAEFRNSRCADEIFVQSVIMTSPYKEKVVSDDLRFVDWSSGPEFPRVFRNEDYERLISIKNKFFARKFDESVDLTILNRLDKHVRE
jgi:hypothetical protein